MKKKLWRILPAVLIAAAVLLTSGQRLDVTRYTLETDKLENNWKLAVLSDLHNKTFGEGNSQLLEKIREYRPDTILICGDMVTRGDPDVSVALDLCRELAKIAEVYYIYGNHEGILQYAEGGPQIPLDQYLAETGVHLLYGGLYRLYNGDDVIELFARSMDARQYRESAKGRQQAAEFVEKDGYKLAMSHFPDLFYEAMADMNFDLAVAGHYHGGQIILPGIGGLYAPEIGWFPEYYGGAYPLKHATLIISRGLGNGTWVPRINNAPELVLIDIVAKHS